MAVWKTRPLWPQSLKTPGKILRSYTLLRSTWRRPFLAYRALERKGFTRDFRIFIENIYSRSTTFLEIGDERSGEINLRRGVRQGDPLSSSIFCIVADELLNSIPKGVGYTIDGTLVKATAYADDINIVSSSKIGIQKALAALERSGQERGLRLNRSKCASISLVPNGKLQKIKVISQPQFKFLDG